MANWDKLNSEFEELINKLSDEDWKSWMKERKKNKRNRIQNLISLSRLHQKFLLDYKKCGIHKTIVKECQDNKFLFTPPENINLSDKKSLENRGFFFVVLQNDYRKKSCICF